MAKYTLKGKNRMEIEISVFLKCKIVKKETRNYHKVRLL